MMKSEKSVTVGAVVGIISCQNQSAEILEEKETMTRDWQ